MNSTPLRILIVDDEPDHRLLFRTMLDEFISPQISFAEASNGQEAMAVFQNWHPHLILMDLWMPDMYGTQVVRQIRALEQQQRQARGLAPSTEQRPVIIIVVSAATFEGDRTQAFESGCDEFVSKPLDPQQFLQILIRHITLFDYGFQEAFQHLYLLPKPQPAPSICIAPTF